MKQLPLISISRTVLRFAPTILTCLGLVLLVVIPAAAQPGGDTIFGRRASMIPDAVRNVVIIMGSLGGLAGAGGVIWGTFGLMRRQQDATSYIWGGGLLMVVGGVVAFVAALAGGEAVPVNGDLSLLVSTLTIFA